MNDLQVFNNPKFGEVRAVEINGDPWFVGKDVATALGYQNPQRAIRDHVDGEDKGVTDMVTPGGKQSISIINESGMYSLIFSSKLPKAKEFKRWVTSEVLPSIRKHGGYLTPELAQQIAKGLEAQAAITQTLTGLVEGLTQRMEALERRENKQTPLQMAVRGDNPFEDCPTLVKPNSNKSRRIWMRTASEKLNMLADKFGLPSTTVLHNLYHELETAHGVCLAEVRIKAMEEHQLTDCSVLLGIFYDKPLCSLFENMVDEYLTTRENPVW